MNETEKEFIISELEKKLSRKESIRPYKESLQEKVTDLCYFESFFQQILKLSDLFDNLKLSTTEKNYERLCKQVQTCGLSETWIKSIIKNAGIELVCIEEKEPEIVQKKETPGSNDSESSNKKEVSSPMLVPSENNKYKYCTNCKKTVMIDVLYCPFCGKAQKMKNCWICKRPIPFGATFCPYCNANNNKK